MAAPSNGNEVQEVFKKNGVVPDVIPVAPETLLQVSHHIT